MKNVPKLRFKGFSDEWEERKLSDIALVIMGQSPVSESYNTNKDGIGLINGPVEFREKYPEIIQYTNKPTKYCEKNDLLLCVRGSSIGRMNISNDRYCIGRGVAAIRNVDGKATDDYIYFLMQYAVDNILKFSTGSTFPNISSEEIKKFEIKVPSLEEQDKIANFLSKVDKLIEKQQEKVNNLEQYKKGMMQKIFSQEIRFKKDDGKEYREWEEKSIGDTLKIKHGKDQKEVICNDGKYPILGTGGEIGRCNIPLYTKESVLIGRKGTIDKPMYMNTPFWTVDTLFYSEIYEGYFSKFIYYRFQFINWKKYCEASGVPSLSASTIESIKYYIPCLEEQIKIANLLSNIDSIVDKEKEKLEELRQWKKGLLQQMFV